jgi:small subunit ribosomal protein S14
MFNLYERSRNVLLAVVQNLSLSSTVRMEAYRALIYLPRDSSITRIRNRCTLTGRSRGIYRKFGLSRLMFRKLAWEGKLRGVKKASWLFPIKSSKT